MRELNRRNLIAGFLAGGSALAAGHSLLSVKGKQKSKRIVVIGGGPAGVAAALATKSADQSARVLLIERDPAQLKHRASNLKEFQKPKLEGVFNRLKTADVEIALDEISEIDWQKQRARGISGRAFAFDDIVVAPGTSAHDEGIPGLDSIARHYWPAAWGSRREAKRLAAQLSAMPAGGHVVLRLPAGEISHPEGLPQRAVAIAQFLSVKNPSAKLTVLDATQGTDAKTAFASAVAKSGPRKHVHWIGGDQPVEILAVDAASGTLETSHGSLKADVVNFITAQQAGTIAQVSGLVDKSGWCPCGPDLRSLINPGAIIVGDANRFARRSIDGAMRSGLQAAQLLART